MKSFIRVLQDIGLLVVRVVAGAILVLHGWRRWQDGIPAQVEILTRFGVPYPEIFGWGTVIFELVGGALLVFGLATPILGAVLVAQQAMLIGYSTFDNGPYLTDGGYEYHAALGALGVVLLVFGAGRAGVDSLFRRSDVDVERRVIDDSAPA